MTGNQTTRTSKTLSRRRKYENKIQVITSFCRETWLGIQCLNLAGECDGVLLASYLIKSKNIQLYGSISNQYHGFISYENNGSISNQYYEYMLYQYYGSISNQYYGPNKSNAPTQIRVFPTVFLGSTNHHQRSCCSYFPPAYSTVQAWCSQTPVGCF